MFVYVLVVLLIHFETVYVTNKRPFSGPASPNSTVGRALPDESVMDVLADMAVDASPLPDGCTAFPSDVSAPPVFPDTPPSSARPAGTPRRRAYPFGKGKTRSLSKKPEYKKCCRLLINEVFAYCRKEKAAYKHCLPADRVCCDRGEAIGIYNDKFIIVLFFEKIYSQFMIL